MELGYVVHPLAQQQGIATEGSRSWMKFAFEEWREPFLHSVIAGANVASLRVATKNGMEATHREIRMEGGLYGLYRRDRSSWV